MNQTPENETESIRSDIDSTRRRMDDTMDALGNRLQGRHLVDEILGFFRSEPGRTSQIGQTISRGASSALHSVTDTVKSNPMPALLIGAGVAWMIYESRRSRSRSSLEDGYDQAASAYDSLENQPDAESLYDRPLEYPSSATVGSSFNESGYAAGAAGGITGDQFGAAGTSSSGSTGSGSKIGQAKDRAMEKASQAGQQVKQKLSNVGSSLRDRSQAVGTQAREMTSRVQESARAAYARSRERIASTANAHPLEIGLACLAGGVIAGLAMPTPRKLDELAGPSIDRLKDRTREAGSELLQKGQRVATAAADAVKNEVQAQGLTLEHLRGQASAVADRAKEAAVNTAQEEGLTPGALKDQASGQGSSTSGGNVQNNPQSDPLASRPVM